MPSVTLYGTYMESLTRGDVAGATYVNYGEVLAPYVSEQYEVGVKAEIEGLLLTLALFEIEKANSYGQVINNVGDQKLTQDGRQRHRGLELSAAGKVFEDLTLYAGATFMEARVKKASNKTTEGKRPANVAESVFKDYAEYALPFLEGASLTGGAYYSGSKYGDAANTDKISGETVFDLGARYKTEMAGAPVTFRLNVANLTDKNYWTNGYYFGSPRTVTFYMDFDF
jgi:iron complex outermembrane receptor protein